MVTLMREAKALNREMMKDAWSAAQAAEPNLVIYHPKALAGSQTAEKLSIPAVLAVPAIERASDNSQMRHCKRRPGRIAGRLESH